MYKLRYPLSTVVQTYRAAVSSSRKFFDCLICLVAKDCAYQMYMGHDRGAFIELKTCNVALLEATDESWGEAVVTWPEKKVIWSMMGTQTTEQGDCFRLLATVSYKLLPTLITFQLQIPLNSALQPILS
ncbi:COBRA-like protein 4 [Tanacetum coccineum]